MTVNRTVVLVGLVSLLLAAAVLAGRGVVTQELTASRTNGGVRWQGLPLYGHWQRTALALWTNALLTDPLCWLIRAFAFMQPLPTSHATRR
jgi:hypothetical protein